jgi:putative membrane-bound dehydrogenase-like protein
MSCQVLRFVCCLLLCASVNAGEQAIDGRLRVLIIDGRNNHDWRATTDALRSTLEYTGRFRVQISSAPEYLGPPALREPKAGDASFAEAKARSDTLAKPSQLALQLAWEQWRPDFANVDAVVLNYNGPAWPAAMRQDFTDFVKRGGGVLLIHAANNAFSDWPEFNAMIGLGWRKGGFGTCLAIDPKTGTGTACCADAATGHGSRHPFVVTNHRTEHPVLKGLPTTWMHGKDELYHHQRGPAENLTILASAFSDPQQRGSNQYEPVLWEVTYGKGRTLVCSLGHQWNGQEDRDGLYCLGFQTLVARSTEYIATGTVTIDVPAQFPSAEHAVISAPHTVVWHRAGKPALATPPAIDWQSKKAEREAAVLTPEEQAASFVLAPGFVPELVAAEPLVQEPVLAVWDGNGAMYVAEMRSYMQDEQGTGTKTLKNGRIKRLVDTDGDGRMDQATVFADGLNLPRMVLPLDDRIAVVETDSSSVWSFRDTNGDGVAEGKTLLYQGKAGDPNKSVEHQDSGLDWNLDNWISISYGRERYRFTDGTWRAQPMHGIWAQWGVTHDDVGRTFFSTNTDPALGFQMPRIYWSLIEKRSGEKPPPNDPISLGLPWEMSFLEAKNLCKRDDRGGDAPERKVFTSACGQSVFRGSALPPEHRGDYFVCDPTIHVVRQANLSNRNGRIWFDSTYGTDEFLVSPDILFRPVNTASGPDGCVTVVDMYRGIIQDAPWLSEGPRAFIKKSGLAEVNQRGRIWRIRHRDHAPLAAPRMLSETTPQLLRHLAHSDGWWRDTAQRLIIQRPDRDSVAPALADLVRFHPDPLCRLHAVWTLEGINALTPDLVRRVWQDSDARVRAAGIRVAEPWFARDDAEFLAAAAKLIEQERDPEVARQLILSLGFSSSPTIIPLIDQLTERHLAHEGVFLATTTVLWKKPSPFIARIQSGDAFKAIANVDQRAQAIARWTQGLGQWNRGLTLPATMPKEQRDLISKGETLFYQNCVSCHGTDGRGVKVPGSELAIAPPLAGSARVRGPAEKMVPVLLNGLMGPIDGITYQGAFMPPAAAIGITRDDRLAEIISFIRYAWGNEASSVTADQVKELRKRHANRQAPWTDGELKALAETPR